MPGRAEELYKMHLIIAPRWMREINGFPFSETTASAFFSPQNLNLLLPRVTPPRAYCATFPVYPFQLRPREPIHRSRR